MAYKEAVSAKSVSENGDSEYSCSFGSTLVTVKDLENQKTVYGENEKINISYTLSCLENESFYVHFPENENIKFYSQDEQRISNGSEFNVEFEVKNAGANEIKIILMTDSDTPEMKISFCVYTYTNEGMTFVDFNCVEYAEEAYYEWLLEQGKIDLEEYDNNNIYLMADDYCDWDIIQHEYGHHVAAKLGFDASSKENHDIGQNSCDDLDNKDAGLKLAWSINQSIESPSFPRGEGDGMAVAAVLLDVADSTASEDMLAFGYNSVYNYIVNNKCVTLYQFINKIQGVSNSRDLYLGNILSSINVSSKCIKPTISASSAKFSWCQPISSYSFHDWSYTLVIYNSSYSKILEINVGTALNYTLSSNQWNKVRTSVASGKNVYWTVKATEKSSPITGPYFSQRMSFEMP